MMHGDAIGRRRVLRSAAGLAAGLAWAAKAEPLSSAPADRPIRIDKPFHGAVLNRRHGQQTAAGLRIRITGQTSAGSLVTINGVPVRSEADRFEGEVLLRDAETDIVARSQGPAGTSEHRVRVVWDRHSFPRYRFSIDDNSFFLRDIARKEYPSLFDCFYMRMLRDLHARYGARFVLNIYFTTDDGFDLTKFPDRYKSEWKDNAEWLRLAFHARADKPDRPYQDAPPERLLADLDQVAEQIHRFAGPEVYTPPTVIHWAMTRPSAFKPLASRGVRALSGYFIKRAGKFDINYALDDERCEYLSRNDALKDFDSGIVFSRVDIICNATPLDRIVPTLEPLAKDPNTAEIMDLFTHEQYFWPFYSNYLPDHPQRLDATLRWVTEHGYKPVFFHEGLLGAPDNL
jgi:hypothetical protein